MMMVNSKSNFLCTLFMLVGGVSITNGQTLRNSNNNMLIETMIQRLDNLETLVHEQLDMIVDLENSIEKHLQTITNLEEKQNEYHRLLHESPSSVPSSAPSSTPTASPVMFETIGVGGGNPNKPAPSCELVWEGGHCTLKADLDVTGHAHLMGGVEVGEPMSTCDDCAVFHNDVTFNDVTTYDAPAHFNQPVKFTEDVTIIGPEVPSSKKDKIKSDDEKYSSLDFQTLNWVKTNFKADKEFLVTSKTKFKKNVAIEDSDSDESPGLTVEGSISSGAA